MASANKPRKKKNPNDATNKLLADGVIVWTPALPRSIHTFHSRHPSRDDVAFKRKMWRTPLSWTIVAGTTYREQGEEGYRFSYSMIERTEKLPFSDPDLQDVISDTAWEEQQSSDNLKTLTPFFIAVPAMGKRMGEDLAHLDRWVMKILDIFQLRKLVSARQMQIYVDAAFDELKSQTVETFADHITAALLKKAEIHNLTHLGLLEVAVNIHDEKSVRNNLSYIEQRLRQIKGIGPKRIEQIWGNLNRAIDKNALPRYQEFLSKLGVYQLQGENLNRYFKIRTIHYDSEEESPLPVTAVKHRE